MEVNVIKRLTTQPYRGIMRWDLSYSSFLISCPSHHHKRGIACSLAIYYLRTGTSPSLMASLVSKHVHCNCHILVKFNFSRAYFELHLDEHIWLRWSKLVLQLIVC
ncbi:hypothetical protein NC652_035335 [Populus alba x Populus x berolinensis]|nr:hypothetical protein NC652_035335 [Populus alba x Populus x berolinensis]